MKKVLSAIVAVTMAVTMFAGCSKNAGSSSSGGGLDKDQYVNALLGSEPTVLDVSRFSIYQDRQVFYNILEPLTRIQDGKVVGAGAKTWDLSSDGLTYTFHLRDNTWSDGVKVKAQDYVYAIKQQATPKNAFSFASDMFCIKNLKQIYNGKMDMSQLGVKAIDDSTLEIDLEATNPALLTTVDFFPAREDQAQKFGTKFGTEADTLLSCGPFTLTSWVHKSELNFTKNSNYWDAKNVRLQKFSYKLISDVSAQYSSLENGSLDLLNITDANYVAKYSKNTNMTNKYVDTARTYMIIFNCKDAVFGNENVRKAFSLAIDRKKITSELMDGLTKPALGLIPSSSVVGTANYRSKVAEPLIAISKENPKPKDVLIKGMQELGLGSDPSTLTVTYNLGGTSATIKTNAEYYQEMWQKALGVTVKLAFNDKTTHVTALKQGTFQMALYSWGANLEPDFQLSRWVGGGLAHWTNSDYDNLMSQGMKMTDDKERLNTYSKAETLLLNKSAIAPIYYEGNQLFTYKYVKGYDSNPFDSVGMKSVYTEGR